MTSFGIFRSKIVHEFIHLSGGRVSEDSRLGVASTLMIDFRPVVGGELWKSDLFTANDPISFQQTCKKIYQRKISLIALEYQLLVQELVRRSS